MSKQKLISAVAALVVGVAGCGGSNGTAKEASTTAVPHKPSVVVTTPVLADVVKTIAGDSVAVHSIVTTGEDPHSHFVDSDDTKAITDADVLIKSGVGLDAWFDRALSTTEHKAPVIDASENVTVRPSNDPLAPLGDPHYWMNPSNVKVVASNVRAALSDADAADASSFELSERSYSSQLDGLSADISSGLSSFVGRTVAVDHEGFDYFCDAYRLTCAGAITPVSGIAVAPNAEGIASVARGLASSQVEKVFAQSNSSPAGAEELATDLGARVITGNQSLYMDTLGAPNSDADTYVKMQRHNLQVLQTNLR